MNYSQNIWTRAPDKSSGRETRPEIPERGDFGILGEEQWLWSAARGILVPNMELKRIKKIIGIIRN